MGKKAGPPPPKKPEGFPEKPGSAFQEFVREHQGEGKNAKDLYAAYEALDNEEKEDRKQRANQKMTEYQQAIVDFQKTPEYKRYVAASNAYRKRKALGDAKARFLKNEPKKPVSAYFLFLSEIRPKLAAENPDIKGLAEMQKKIAETWGGLSADERQGWQNKQKEAQSEYEEQMREFKETEQYKMYMKVANRFNKKPKVIKKGGKTKIVKKGPLPPAAPANMPKKPMSAFFLFCAEQRGSGENKSPRELNAAWIALGAEGQKTMHDKVADQTRQYEEDFKEFQKTLEGKKYLRAKAAFEKKKRVDVAKKRFLGGETGEAPKKPPGSYYLFVQEKRNTLPAGGHRELGKQIHELWQAASAEEKKVFEDKHEALKEQYEKDLQEYKASSGYKKYAKSLSSIHGGGVKAKAAKAKKSQAKAKAKSKAKASKKGKSKNNAKDDSSSDSDSDVMGSDSDDSSSSDSDSD